MRRCRFLPALLLAGETTTVSNVPQLRDVSTMITLLQSMGVETTIDEKLNIQVDSSQGE